MNIFKTKTFWAGVAGLVVAVGGYITGDAEAVTSAQTAVISLIGIFLRSAISKIPGVSVEE